MGRLWRLRRGIESAVADEWVRFQGMSPEVYAFLKVTDATIIGTPIATPPAIAP